MSDHQTKRLKANSQGVSQAADTLRDGGLVAFPTETVYGLGADACNGQAVARVFEAKGRPAFNPLIVHVADLEMAQRIGVIGDQALSLVVDDWPKALTIVVPLRAHTGLSELVTAGQNTVAIRVPCSEIALQVLRAFGGPVAAPSANPSGRISPTTAAHVLNGLDGRIDAVLDGGATPAGIESTIIGFLGDAPELLREGAYVPARDMTVGTGSETAPTAPGQLASHYAPLARVRLNATVAQSGEFLIGFDDIAGDITLSSTGDLIEAAATLYAALHEADARGVTQLAIAPIPEIGLGRAINDRLRRAAAPRE